MLNAFKAVGLLLGVVLVVGCAVVSSSDVPQREPEPTVISTATETPVEPALAGNSPSLDTLVPGEVETATFALG